MAHHYDEGSNLILTQEEAIIKMQQLQQQNAQSTPLSPTETIGPGLAGGGGVYDPSRSVQGEALAVGKDPLTTAQRLHLETVVNQFTLHCRLKYVKGQREHGGDLHLKPVIWLLDQAIDEAIDQVVYLLTLKQRLG